MTRKKLTVEHKEIELKPDAWPRFERFIRDIVKAGPQHRKPKTQPAERRTEKKPRGKARVSRA